MKKKILIINGPNLNLLGIREPGIYGTKTLDEIEKEIIKAAEKRGVEAECRQSNHEGRIVDWIQESRDKYQGIIINPAGLSHSSYSILDALKAVNLPAVEVHLSNILAREDFRGKSVTASACLGVITGLGWRGYVCALNYLLENS